MKDCLKVMLCMTSLLLAPVIAPASILIFDLPDGNTLPDPSVWTLPYVDGVSIRESWKKVETANGVYDYSLFDQAAALCAQYGKKLEIRVQIEAGNTPDWVVGNLGGPLFFTPPDGSAAVWVYWDTIALPAAEAMYQALGTRYAGNPVVYVVSASCDTQGAGDWYVPHTAADNQAWRQAPYSYTSSKNQNACEQLVTTICQAFPHQFVYVSAGRNGNLDATPCEVSENVCSYCYGAFPNQFACGRDGWSAFQAPPNRTAIGTEWEAPFAEFPNRMGAQALWWVFGDTTYRDNAGVADTPQNILTAMFGIAHRWNLIWLEVYQIDCLNLGSVISANK